MEKVTVTLGQAKNVAKAFYDRFHEINSDGTYVKQQLVACGYPPTYWDNETPNAALYPWTNSASDDENYAPLTVGQLKALFSFEISYDGDEDHISDLNEWQMGFNAANPDEDNNGILDGFDDQDGDGFHNAMEIENGTDAQDANSKPDPNANAEYLLYTPLIEESQ